MVEVNSCYGDYGVGKVNKYILDFYRKAVLIFALVFFKVICSNLFSLFYFEEREVLVILKICGYGIWVDINNLNLKYVYDFFIRVGGYGK